MSTPRRRRKDREPLNQIGTLATVPSATGDMRKPGEGHTIEPAHDDIAGRAYQLFEERGGEHGHDWEDWFQAERELRQLTLQEVIERALATEGPYAVA
jgi:hypothetical protein